LQQVLYTCDAIPVNQPTMTHEGIKPRPLRWLLHTSTLNLLPKQMPYCIQNIYVNNKKYTVMGLVG